MIVTRSFYIERLLNTAIIMVLDTLRKNVAGAKKAMKVGSHLSAESCAIKYKLRIGYFFPSTSTERRDRCLKRRSSSLFHCVLYEFIGNGTLSDYRVALLVIRPILSVLFVDQLTSRSPVRLRTSKMGNHNYSQRNSVIY